MYALQDQVMHPLYGAQPETRVPVHVTRSAVIAHWYTYSMRLLAAEPVSITGLLFYCHCLSGTILVTPYSMVWDWQVSRAGPMPFY